MEDKVQTKNIESILKCYKQIQKLHKNSLDFKAELLKSLQELTNSISSTYQENVDEIKPQIIESALIKKDAEIIEQLKQPLEDQRKLQYELAKLLAEIQRE